MIDTIEDSQRARAIIWSTLKMHMPSLTVDTFIQKTQGFKFHTVGIEGAVMINGAEIHYARLPEYKGRCLTKTKIREHIKPILDEYGYAFTMVRKENKIGDIFVRRIGFKKIGEQDTLNLYVLEESKYVS